MQYIETLTVNTLPVKFPLVIFFSKCHNHLIRLFFIATDNFSGHLLALRLCALTPDFAFIPAQEGANMAERQAYPHPVVRVFGFATFGRSAFVRLDAVKPARIGVHAEDEDAVVWHRDSLRDSLTINNC